MALSIELLRPANWDLGPLRLPGPAAAETKFEDWQWRLIRRYARGGGEVVVLDAAGLAFSGGPELARELSGGRYRPPRGWPVL